MKKQRWDGYVYIVSLGFDSLFKIGKTRNFNNRIKTLKTSNPRLRKIVCIWVKDRHLCEKELHFRFRNKLLQREVFKLDNIDITKARQYLMINIPDGISRHRQSKTYQRWLKLKGRPSPPESIKVSTHVKHGKATQLYKDSTLRHSHEES